MADYQKALDEMLLKQLEERKEFATKRESEDKDCKNIEVARIANFLEEFTQKKELVTREYEHTCKRFRRTRRAEDEILNKIHTTQLTDLAYLWGTKGDEATLKWIQSQDRDDGEAVLVDAGDQPKRHSHVRAAKKFHEVQAVKTPTRKSKKPAAPVMLSSSEEDEPVDMSSFRSRRRYNQKVLQAMLDPVATTVEIMMTSTTPPESAKKPRTVSFGKKPFTQAQQDLFYKGFQSDGFIKEIPEQRTEGTTMDIDEE